MEFKKTDFEFVQMNEAIFDETPQGKPVGFLQDAMIRFAKNKVSLVSFVILVFFIVMAIFGPGMNEYTYRKQSVSLALLPPRVAWIEKLGLGLFDGRQTVRSRKENLEKNYGDSVIRVVREFDIDMQGTVYKMVDAEVNMYKYKGAENTYYWFGTDDLGRDLWTRMWRGTRISLILAFGTVAINLLIGLIYGSISGYYGGRVDMLMQRVAEILWAIPGIPLLILCILFFGASITTFMIAFCLTGWIGFSMLIRGQFYRYKGMEYVLASRTMGSNDFSLIFKHILPNAIGPLITSATLSIPGVIFSEATLSYIGIGLKPPEPSIGILLTNGQQFLTQYPHVIFFPAAAISVLMLSFNLAGNGLRDAFDPTQRR